MKYYSAKTVTQLLGVTAQTLRNWDKVGKLKPAYIKSNGYRYYSEDSILSYTQERKTKKDLNVIGYARVSSKKQIDDLERQVNNLKLYLDNKYKDYDIITDIGSGINYTKKGILSLIDKINKTEDEELVEDLIQIITVFSCRLQGRRKSKTKEILDEFYKKMQEISNN